MSGIERSPVFAFAFMSLILSACGGEEYSNALADGSSPTALSEGGSWSTPLVDGTNASSDGFTSVDTGSETALRPGVYGTDIASTNGGSENAVTWISKSGRYVTAIRGNNAVFGNVEETSEEGVLEGTATSVFFNGTWNRDEGSLIGLVIDPVSLIYSITGDFSANAELTRFVDLSNDAQSLSDLSGSYTSTDMTTTFTIDGTGGLSGADSTGCVFDGEISVQASSVNVVDVTFDASNCGSTSSSSASERNGRYTGLGSYDSVNFIISLYSINGTVILPFQGRR